jgi:hypothetical protein
LARGTGPKARAAVLADEALLLQALWCVALLRRELVALTEGMDAAARAIARRVAA